MGIFDFMLGGDTATGYSSGDDWSFQDSIVSDPFTAAMDEYYGNNGSWFSDFSLPSTDFLTMSGDGLMGLINGDIGLSSFGDSTPWMDTPFELDNFYSATSGLPADVRTSYIDGIGYLVDDAGNYVGYQNESGDPTYYTDLINQSGGSGLDYIQGFAKKALDLYGAIPKGAQGQIANVAKGALSKVVGGLPGGDATATAQNGYKTAQGALAMAQLLAKLANAATKGAGVPVSEFAREGASAKNGPSFANAQANRAARKR